MVDVLASGARGMCFLSNSFLSARVYARFPAGQPRPRAGNLLLFLGSRPRKPEGGALSRGSVGPQPHLKKCEALAPSRVGWVPAEFTSAGRGGACLPAIPTS